MKNYSKEVTEEEKKEIAAVFANKLFSNPLLSEVWKNAKPGNYKDAFNFAYKINYKSIKEKHPTRSNYFTPPGGFRLPSFTVQLFADRIILNLEPVKKTISKWEKRTGKKIKYSICPMISLYQRTKKNAAPYVIIPITHKASLFDSKKSIDTFITLNKKAESIALQYCRMILYTSIILLDEKDKIIAYSGASSVSIRYR